MSISGVDENPNNLNSPSLNINDLFNSPNIFLPTESNVNAKIACVDSYLKENYWYFLRGAALIFTENITTTKRVYSVLTYINITGTYVVIGSCDVNDKVHINTFVRVGKGAAKL